VMEETAAEGDGAEGGAPAKTRKVKVKKKRVDKEAKHGGDRR